MYKSALEPDNLVRNSDHNKGRLLSWLCGFFVVVYIGRLQELFPELSSLYLGKVAFALNFLYLVFTMKLDRISAIFRGNKTSKTILFMIVLSICSIPLSYWPSGSVKVVMDVIFLNIFFYFILTYSINDEDDILYLIYFGIITAGLIGIVALNVVGMDRLSVSSTYDSNDTAYVIVCFMPLVYYAAKVRAGIVKLLLFALLGAMMVVVIKTGSRGGSLGMLVVFGVILFRDSKDISKAILIALLVGGVFFAFAGQEYWDRMGTIVDTNDYNYSARGGRLDLWKNGFKMMLSHPLLGVGVGQYNVAEGLSHADVGGKWSTAHNAYLQIGVELGLPGFLLFIILLSSNIKTIRRLQRESCHSIASRNLLAICSGLEVSMYGYCTCVIFLSQAYSPVLMYISAMISGVDIVRRRLS